MLALALVRRDAVQHWRSMLGPTDVSQAQEEEPDWYRCPASTQNLTPDTDIDTQSPEPNPNTDIDTHSPEPNPNTDIDTHNPAVDPTLFPQKHFSSWNLDFWQRSPFTNTLSVKAVLLLNEMTVYGYFSNDLPFHPVSVYLVFF